MRSRHPIPGNPWPHGMVIRVDSPDLLLTLLFIRSAWRLDVPDAPVLDPVPAPGGSGAPSSASPAEWVARWREEWANAWRWLAEDGEEAIRDAFDRRRLGETVDFTGLLPPRWQSSFGEDGIDGEALRAWQGALFEHPGGRLEEQPERRSLDAMIAAWESGIDSIVELPYRGHHVERRGRRLVVSRTTRRTPRLYELALTKAAEA